MKSQVRYIYLLVVFCMTFYAVQFWPIGIMYYISIGIGLIIPMIVCPQFLSSKQFVLFLFYLIIVFLNYFSGDDYYKTPITVLKCDATLFVALSFSFYILSKKDYNLIKLIIYLTIFILLWTTIATAVFDFESPGIVRSVHSLAQMGEDINPFRALYALGLSGYTLPHALPIMIPPIVMGIRNHNGRSYIKYFNMLFLFVILALVYFSGASGPVITAILILLLSLIVTKGRASSNFSRITIFVIVFLPFIFNDEITLSVLDWIGGLLGDESHFQAKIFAMQNTLQYGEAAGDVGERQDIYSSTFMSFLDNFLIGAHSFTGGHSVLLDKMASLGLIGSVPFFSILYIHVKSVIKQIPSEFIIYYYLGLIAAFIMLASKGIATWEIWFALMVFLPIYILYYCKFYNNQLIVKRVKR